MAASSSRVYPKFGHARFSCYSAKQYLAVIRLFDFSRNSDKMRLSEWADNFLNVFLTHFPSSRHRGTAGPTARIDP